MLGAEICRGERESARREAAGETILREAAAGAATAERTRKCVCFQRHWPAPAMMKLMIIERSIRQ